MNEQNRNKTEIPETKHMAGAAIGFGTSFATGMAVFALGGHWLDVKTGREPLFTLLGIFLGLAYGGWELWKLIAVPNRPADEKTSRQDKNGGKHNDTRES